MLVTAADVPIVAPTGFSSTKENLPLPAACQSKRVGTETSARACPGAKLTRPKEYPDKLPIG